MACAVCARGVRAARGVMALDAGVRISKARGGAGSGVRCMHGARRGARWCVKVAVVRDGGVWHGGALQMQVCGKRGAAGYACVRVVACAVCVCGGACGCR